VDLNGPRTFSVLLVLVDEDVLAELVAVATSAATAGEVTPPLTPGDDWTPERARWMEDFHRQRREGLEGPAKEATWAVVAEGRVAGSVRLKAIAAPHAFEAGIWLARHERGKGFGRQALAAVLERAAAVGAHEVLAETTHANKAAQGLLRSLGFGVVATGDGRVHGKLNLGDRRAL
jgi:RimJ/RimL family protein N-acetyltransferase